MIDTHDSQKGAANCVDRRVLVLLIFAALAIRIGVLVIMPRTFVDDPDAYRAVAINVVEHGCFGQGDRPTACRPLLYPLVVAGCQLVDPALWYSLAVVHVVLGVATVVLTYRLALRWGVSRWALLAPVLVAIDPILLVHSTLVMTETLATFLAVAGLLALTRCAERPSAGWAALSGAVMALAVLCRPTFLVWMALAVVLLPFAAAPWRSRVRLFAAVVFAVAVVLSPWAIRNAIHFGKLTPATNHGGFTLLLANNSSFYEYLRTARPGEVWNADQFHRDWSVRSRDMNPRDEVAVDHLAYAEALAVIRNEPRTFAYACLVHVSRFWGLVPHRTNEAEGTMGCTARWLVGGFYAVESFLAIVGLACLFRGGVPRDRVLRGWIWGLILVASFTAIHTFYWTNMRMRAPLIPVICIAAALGASRVFRGPVRRRPS
jgi:4-amino-4-deoxy-L-arabinose transferase-like glycosyltransferase